jgi:gliding motility-associated-like protein
MSINYGNKLISWQGAYNINLQTVKGCDSIINLYAIYYDQPNYENIVPLNACIGEAITLTTKAFNSNNNYYWSAVGGALQNQNQNQATFIFNSEGYHDFTVTITPPAPCVPYTIIDTINVHAPIALIEKAFSNVPICKNEEIILHSVYNNYYNFEWEPSNIFAGNTQDVKGSINEKTLVTLTVTDTFNCVASSTKELDIINCCQVYMPNVFSPNGDGKNDRILPNLEYSVVLNRFMIFNQWGETIFTTNQKEIGWDGYYKGLPMDVDTYHYLIEYICNGVVKVEKGDVTLVR